MIIRQIKHIPGAIYALYADSGFSMAGAVAYSFVLSLFPFCIFLGALAAYFGGEALAKQGVEQLFEMVPAPVAEALAPEVMAVMGQQPVRAADRRRAHRPVLRHQRHREPARGAQRRLPRKEARSYFWCLLESALFVVLSAVGMLVLTWGVVVGPQLAARFKPRLAAVARRTGWIALLTRYAIVIAAIGMQLIAYHLWLAAGQRRLGDVWPGVLLSIGLWVVAAQLFASWLDISDYSRFYAGLTQIMSALVFFQVTAIIVILGAELNRGLVELRRTPAERDSRPARLRERTRAALALSRSACGSPRWHPRRCAGPWSGR